MTASHKEEQHSIDLIENNYVYGNTKHEGKLVFLYIYLGLTGLLKWSFKYSDRYGSHTTKLSQTVLETPAYPDRKSNEKGWVWKHVCLTVLL